MTRMNFGQARLFHRDCLLDFLPQVVASLGRGLGLVEDDQLLGAHGGAGWSQLSDASVSQLFAIELMCPWSDLLLLTSHK